MEDPLSGDAVVYKEALHQVGFTFPFADVVPANTDNGVDHPFVV